MKTIKLKNYEIETFLNVLMSDKSFVKTMRLPCAVRHAIRLNIDTLSSRAKLIHDERMEIANRYIANGQAVSDGEKIEFKSECVNEANEELTELAFLDNELTIETIDKDSLEKVLEYELTMAEEDVLIAFSDNSETERG